MRLSAGIYAALDGAGRFKFRAAYRSRAPTCFAQGFVTFHHDGSGNDPRLQYALLLAQWWLCAGKIRGSENGAVMDLSFATALYSALSEEETPIGAVFKAADAFYLVPFLCNGHQFMMFFQPLASYDENGVVSRIIEREAKHTVSLNAQVVKFASMAQCTSGLDFSPISASLKEKLAVYRCIPDRLGASLQAFIDYSPDADEFYFVPGAATERRVKKLSLWYHSIGDNLSTSLGLTRIHTHGGEWHGYRKCDS